MVEPKLVHSALVRPESVVPGIVGQAQPQTRDMISITPKDILLVEKPARRIFDVEDMLELENGAQKEMLADLELRMQVDVILLKFIRFLVAAGRPFTQTPEIIGE